jgi:hypothetical protein
MISHPYTSAQRGTWHRHTANDHTLWWDQRPRARFTDPSMEPWTEHEQPAIVRARIADGWITDKVRGEPWLRAGNFGRAPALEAGRPSPAHAWMIICAFSYRIVEGDALALRRELIDVMRNGDHIRQVMRGDEKVFVTYDEAGISVAKEHPDGTIEILDCAVLPQSKQTGFIFDSGPRRAYMIEPCKWPGAARNPDNFGFPPIDTE